MPIVENAVGYASAAAIGYIHGNIPGAVKGVQAFNVAKRVRDSVSAGYESVSKRFRAGENTDYKKTRSKVSSMPAKRTAKKPKAKKRPSVRKEILRLADTKHLTLDNNQVLASILQSNVHSHCVTAQLVQGTTNNARIGDEVYLQSIDIRGYFFSNATAGAYMCRVIVGWSGLEANNATGPVPFVGSLASSDIFLPGTVGGNTALAIVNPKAFQVVADMTIECNSQIAATVDIASFHKVARLNAKFPYRGSGSVFGKYKNLYIVFAGFVAGGAVGVTNAGQVSMSYDLKFKDF